MLDLNDPRVLTVLIFCVIMIFTVFLDVILVLTLRTLNRKLDRQIERRKAKKEK